MFIVSRVNYHSLLGRAFWLYGGTLVLLVVTFLVGAKVFGSRRWIPIAGGFHLQVSEFAKIVIILLVARVLSELRMPQVELHDLAKLGALVSAPFLLVLAQPDLGTALTYLPPLAAGVILVGMRWRHAILLALLAILMLPLTWFVLRDFQKDRLLTFVDPMRDPQGKGYQVIQSRIAIGNGGLWGQGATKGSQTQHRFLPVAHTDFIFSAYAEEHGFIGVVVALGLYYLLLMQIVQNAPSAPDRAGTIICMGVAATLLFHLLENVGMVAGRMPVAGIPLPFMSYGGSNTSSMFLMLGLVNNVRLQRIFS
jgi:rod shape determining protein RodA